MTRVSSYAVVVVMLSAGVVACDYKHSSTSTSPSSIPNGASAGVGSLLGVWTSGSGGTGASLPVPDPKTCNNFQWSITQQTGNAVSGTFSAVCANAISLSGTANGQLVGTSVPMVVNGTATLPGLGNCAFTINGTGYIEDSGNSLRIPYNATTCIGPFSGEETLHRPQPAAPSPTPTPDPPAPPAPPPPPPPSSPDQIDLNTVQIMLGPNIATWPQTSTVTSTVAVDHQLCIYHTKLGQWPSTIFFDDPNTLVEGNQWIFANINGQWYAGAGDWYRPGQACKDVTPQTIAHDAFYSDNMEPLRSWVPQPGEVFGLMASTPARAWPAMRTVDERSNVVLVRWGQ